MIELFLPLSLISVDSEHIILFSLLIFTEEEILKATSGSLVKHQVHIGSSHLAHEINFRYQVDEWDLNTNQR